MSINSIEFGKWGFSGRREPLWTSRLNLYYKSKTPTKMDRRESLLIKLNLMLAGLCGLALSAATAAAESVLLPQAPIEILPFELRADGLAGPGGDRLRAELVDAQFIAVGEDHGFAGPPQFAAALAVEVGKVPGAPLYHAVEVGPHTTRQVADRLRGGGLSALDLLLEGRPFAMPFLSNAEDAALALPFARSGRLWGIDQEFVGSTGLLCDMLIARTRDPEVKRKLAAWRDGDRANLVAGRFDQALMTATDLTEFEALRPAFSGDAQGLRLLEDLIASARIYQYNNVERYAENNGERSRLMQNYFLEHYRAVRGQRPRVLLKMGAYHLGRGTTPTSIYDIGSLLPGLAAANNKRSLHVVFMPLAGKVRSIKPTPQGFTTVGNYEDDSVSKLLGAAGISQDRLPEHGLVLIPLKPIRHRLTGRQLREMGTYPMFMVLGFDYLVTTRDAVAATHFEAWSPETAP